MKKITKLTLNKSIVSNLTREETSKIRGGGITEGCQTAVYEGCEPGYSWENCSEVCSEYCGTGLPCTVITGNVATCNGCETDYGCDPNFSVVFC